jgi:iron(III) transport system permease protein
LVLALARLLLPIITPPFVVGLGLILLFGRAGVVNQFLEVAFGIPPTRWFYGWFGVWLAQTFAFTPIAFMIMRGVVQGVAPSLEEAAQTLRASPHKTFMTVTLPLLKPGLANAFLVGFIESMADFGNPIVVGGQFSVLSTEIFFAIVGAQYDQGRAASLAWMLTFFALTVFAIQRGLLGKQSFTTVSGKGDAGIAMPLPTGVRRVVHSIALPWMAFTLIVYLFALCWRLCADLGARLHHHAQPLPHRVQCGMGRVRHGVGGHGVELVLHHHQAGGHLGAAHGRAGHCCIAWLLARTEFRGQGAFEFSRCWPLPSRAPCWA